jgi:hypothetical protein
LRAAVVDVQPQLTLPSIPFLVNVVKAFGAGLILKRLQISQTSLHDMTLASASRLTRVLAPLHLANDELKCLEDVLVVARARFGPGALELFGKGLAILGCDLALLGTEVGLVAHDNNRDPLDSLDGVCG